MSAQLVLNGFVGLCSGFVVSGAVFAFIVAIGIVPRLAIRSGTQKYVRFYENMISVGGVFGATTIFVDYSIPIGQVGGAVTGLAYGVFLGCLAVCLAEVLNVLPIMARRAKLQKGISVFIFSLAVGKAAGALVYFFSPFNF
ncbi:MAG: stage V sporulation protein AB [Defluviitaleaceae bacterium]|nr:stage V sporulation protein AB [Defluviitaleaceae bacterium]